MTEPDSTHWPYVSFGPSGIKTNIANAVCPQAISAINSHSIASPIHRHTERYTYTATRMSVAPTMVSTNSFVSSDIFSSRGGVESSPGVSVWDVTAVTQTRALSGCGLPLHSGRRRLNHRGIPVETVLKAKAAGVATGPRDSISGSRRLPHQCPQPAARAVDPRTQYVSRVHPSSLRSGTCAQQALSHQ